jgi:hypothetical protein
MSNVLKRKASDLTAESTPNKKAKTDLGKMVLVITNIHFGEEEKIYLLIKEEVLNEYDNLIELFDDSFADDYNSLTQEELETLSNLEPIKTIINKSKQEKRTEKQENDSDGNKSDQEEEEQTEDGDEHSDFTAVEWWFKVVDYLLETKRVIQLKEHKTLDLPCTIIGLKDYSFIM